MWLECNRHVSQVRGRCKSQLRVLVLGDGLAAKDPFGRFGRVSLRRDIFSRYEWQI